MADLKPDYFVEQQRVRMNIAAMRTQVERAKLEIMEMAARREKAIESIETSQQAIVKMEATLEELIQTHGDPPKE